MMTRKAARTTFSHRAVASALAGTLTALLVWMFSAASAFAVVVG
jgi:hypothetical protein